MLQVQVPASILESTNPPHAVDKGGKVVILTEIIGKITEGD
jgi:hypothetical protein